MKYRPLFLSRLTRRFLNLFADEDMGDSILEDLEDRYAIDRKRKGPGPSGVIWLSKLLLIGTAFIMKSITWKAAMFKNNLKIASRNLVHHKGYALIHLAGMAVGFTCAILIFLWVRDERSFDRFHKNAERIYRVVASSDGNGAPTNANGSFGVGPAMKRDFPEVVENVRIRKMGQNVKRYVGYKDKKFYESRFFFAESTIFSVFDFPLIKGNPATALKEPNALVITRAMAEKYFGAENPIGKTIEADPYNDGQIMLFLITGIAENVPHNSHFHFDFLAAYEGQKENTSEISGFYQHFTYVLLDNPSSAALLDNKLLDFLHRNWRKDPWYTLSLQPLLDIHLFSRLRSEIEANGNILYVYLFTAVAFFILLTACINFMNLSTARAAKRAKEIGIRKVVGARRNQLIQQFLGESLLICLFSGLAAAGMVIILLPLFNRLTDKEIQLHLLADPLFVLGSVALFLVVGFISGIYPAFFLSSYRPSHTLKPGLSGSASGSALRKALVIFQFALSIAIITSTVIVHRQMQYIRTRYLGYDKDQILVVPMNKDLRGKYEGFKTELLKYPGILNMTTSAYVPTRGSAHLTFQFEGREKYLSQVIYLVDENFIDTYGLKLLAGSNIRNPLSRDVNTGFLASKLTIQEAGYSSPEDAIGKSVSLEEYRGYIAGVVNDIHIYSLHRSPYAILYVVTPIRNHDYLSIRIHPGRLNETLYVLHKTWREMIPAYPLDYFFLDSSFEAMHISDQKMGEIFSVFSILAVFIACMGLFGLAAHAAEQKTKEIGVRKILGASTLSLYFLLSRDFLKWVALANLIAWPAAFFVMHGWLRNFAFRISIGWTVFPMAGCAALIVAMLTVSLQIIKASVSDPVKALRYE